MFVGSSGALYASWEKGTLLIIRIITSDEWWERPASFASISTACLAANIQPHCMHVFLFSAKAYASLLDPVVLFCNRKIASEALSENETSSIIPGGI